jgi:hypothetical protein
MRTIEDALALAHMRDESRSDHGSSGGASRSLCAALHPYGWPKISTLFWMALLGRRSFGGEGPVLCG